MVAISSLSADETDRGAVAGNGGMMTEKKQPLKVTKKEKSAVRKPRTACRKKPAANAKEAPAANSDYAEAERSAETGADAAAGMNGKRVLFNSANATLVIKSRDITAKLGEKAAEGDNASTKLLMEMMKLGDMEEMSSSQRLKDLINKLESDSEQMNAELEKDGKS